MQQSGKSTIMQTRKEMRKSFFNIFIVILLSGVNFFRNKYANEREIWKLC